MKLKNYSNKVKKSIIDLKYTWKILNGLLRPNRSSSKSNSTIDDQILTTPEKVAVAFNDYFSSVASLLDDAFLNKKNKIK